MRGRKNERVGTSEQPGEFDLKTCCAFAWLSACALNSSFIVDSPNPGACCEGCCKELTNCEIKDFVEVREDVAGEVGMVAGGGAECGNLLPPWAAAGFSDADGRTAAGFCDEADAAGLSEAEDPCEAAMVATPFLDAACGEAGEADPCEEEDSSSSDR